MLNHFLSAKVLQESVLSYQPKPFTAIYPAANESPKSVILFLNFIAIEYSGQLGIMFTKIISNFINISAD